MTVPGAVDDDPCTPRAGAAVVADAVDELTPLKMLRFGGDLFAAAAPAVVELPPLTSPFRFSPSHVLPPLADPPAAVADRRAALRAARDACAARYGMVDVHLRLDVLAAPAAVSPCANLYVYVVTKSAFTHLAKSFFALPQNFNQRARETVARGGPDDPAWAKHVNNTVLSVVLLPCKPPEAPDDGFLGACVRGSLVLVCYVEDHDVARADVTLGFAGVVAGDPVVNSLDAATRVQGLPDDWARYEDNNMLLLPVHLVYSFLAPPARVTLAGLCGDQFMDLSTMLLDPRLPLPLELLMADVPAKLRLTPGDDELDEAPVARAVVAALGSGRGGLTAAHVVNALRGTPGAAGTANFRKNVRQVPSLLRAVARTREALGVPPAALPADL